MDTVMELIFYAGYISVIFAGITTFLVWGWFHHLTKKNQES